MSQVVNVATIETKYDKFNSAVESFAKELVSEGLCYDFTVYSNPGDINEVVLCIRPISDVLPFEKHKEVTDRYHELMNSYGITEDEYDKSHGSLRWTFARKGRV